MITLRRHHHRRTRLTLALGLITGLLMVNQGFAQERQEDPRVGLAAGFLDAGQALHNMELVRNLPKPEGFYDPEQPAGAPRMPPEPEPEEGEEAPTNPPTRPPQGLSYTNSDLAFIDDYMFVGNYHGFNTYSVEDPQEVERLASFVCPGGQGDVSVYGNLLFMSVEQTRGRLDCGVGGVEAPISSERFRGVRIFDISDIRRPQQVAAIQTCRGSHTHTVVPDPNDSTNV